MQFEDQRRGYKFSTYATSVDSPGVACCSPTRPAPFVLMHAVRNHQQAGANQPATGAGAGREPRAEEIAHRLGVEKVRKTKEIAHSNPISLETPSAKREDSHLGEFIESQSSVSPSTQPSASACRSRPNPAEDADAARRVIRSGLDWKMVPETARWKKWDSPSLWLAKAHSADRRRAAAGYIYQGQSPLVPRR